LTPTARFVVRRASATLSTCWAGLTQRQNPESPVGTVRLAREERVTKYN
jgi:hypothetical protein